jgi:hypothetical protein
MVAVLQARGLTVGDGVKGGRSLRRRVSPTHPRAATQGRPYGNLPRPVSLFSRQVGREAGRRGLG